MSIIVTFGGHEYTVDELGIAASAKWREQFERVSGDLVDAVVITQTQQQDMSSLISAVAKMKDILIKSPDTLLELLYAYSPTLKNAKEAIETEGKPSEIVPAFIEVLKLAYPFGGLLSWASGLAPTASAPTSTS